MLSKEEANIAENIRQLMDEHELSLRQLAGKSGVNYGTIHGFLSTGHSPRVASIIAIGKVFDKSIAELMQPAPKRRAVKASA